MSTYLKLGAALLVVVIGGIEWAQYKERLRLEGENRVLQEQLEPAQDSLDALRESRRIADSIRAAEVAQAAQEAAEARQSAERAQQEARTARRQRDQVRAAVIEEYGDTVAAAVARVEAAADAEIERVQSIADLRAAEAVAWERAFNEEQARRIDAEELATRERQVSEAKDRIIDRLNGQLDRKGHSVLVDGLIGAGGVVLGYLVSEARR